MTDPLEGLRKALEAVPTNFDGLCDKDDALAALDAFAHDHPGLRDDTRSCVCCGTLYAPADGNPEWLNPWTYCRECRKRESTGEPCPKCSKEADHD